MTSVLTLPASLLSGVLFTLVGAALQRAVIVETRAAAIGSAFPWPYGWSSSAGVEARTTPRQTISELNTSASDSTASATNA